MAAVKGNCYLCGKELGKTAMKNHIEKEHSAEDGQECRLLKIEGAYDKNYWLYVDIPASSDLSVLDSFLRKIWLECCGHMSAFSGQYGEVDMTRKIGTFNTGDILLHEYDFGSTTETLITIVSTVYRKQQRGVRLLARNIPMTFVCRKCGKPAELINTEDFDDPNPFYCISCAKKDDELYEMSLPITNSPRMGVCGYTGELDTYAFDPKIPEQHERGLGKK